MSRQRYTLPNVGLFSILEFQTKIFKVNKKLLDDKKADPCYQFLFLVNVMLNVDVLG